MVLSDFHNFYIIDSAIMVAISIVWIYFIGTVISYYKDMKLAEERDAELSVPMQPKY